MIGLYYYSPKMAERSFRNVRKTRKHLKFETLSDGGLTEQLYTLATAAAEPCKELVTKVERLVLKGRARRATGNGVAPRVCGI